MNVEDEYFSIIEKRNTTIMLNQRTIAEQNAAIKAQKAAIKAQKAAIKAQATQLKERDTQLQTSIKLLLQAGMSPDLIAVQLGVDLQTVKKMA